ncbi:RagB/SusD family nutrient uptake outer membrane protein [Sphingobacterium sp. xlx-96]|nr:RagB/SusD family nutrient uptake outer membrane protein [Sphingobacterium sp. xlx-96]
MKFKLVLIGVMIFVISSCTKFLEVDLINQVDEHKLFSKEQGYVDALSGVYSQISEPNLYGQKLSFELIDVLAQYYDYNTIAENYKELRDYNYKNASVKRDIDGIWSKMYAAIAATNNILRWEQKNGDVMRPHIRKQVVGEALALRAFLHFDLLRMFTEDVKFNHNAEGIPYNKEFGVALPPVYTAAECLKLVLLDLELAGSHLEEDPINEVVPFQMLDKNAADKYVARINKFAVKALMARVYMTIGDKLNAVKFAKEVIESQKFRLLDYETSIDVPDAERDFLFSDEHIFSLRNKDIPEMSKALHFNIIGGGVVNQAKLPFGAPAVIYSANSDDARYQFWFDISNFAKYTRGDAKLFYPKIPLIKLSEMYLIVSEALYSTDLNACLNYINTLRRSRIRNASDWHFISRDVLFEELIREYPGEGQLFYAYKRLNKDIKNNSGITDIPASKQIFVFPIPEKEIETGHR